MIKIRDLEIFFWTAQLRSFSRAAEKLNSTQPTVSQRIASLEEQLGRHLINRTTKPISLTGDGRVLQQHAELILRQISKLESEFKLLHQTPKTIRLGVSETIVQTWLGAFLEASHKIYPTLNFDVSVDITDTMMSSLRDGELDITFMLGPAAVDGLACRHLIDYPLQFYGVPGLIDGNHLSAEDMRRFPVLTYPRHAYPYTLLRELLFGMIDDQPRIFTNSSLSTIEKMAIDGMGVALVAQDVFSPSIRRGRLVPLECDIDLPPLRFYAFYVLGIGAGILEDLTSIAAQVAASS